MAEFNQGIKAEEPKRKGPAFAQGAGTGDVSLWRVWRLFRCRFFVHVEQFCTGCKRSPRSFNRFEEGLGFHDVDQVLAFAPLSDSGDGARGLIDRLLGWPRAEFCLPPDRTEDPICPFAVRDFAGDSATDCGLGASVQRR